MRTRIVVVAAVAVLGLFGGCSGDADPAQPSPTETAVEQSPAASPAASSQSPASESPSPSTSSESPTSDGDEVTAADGALSWTMPCKPVKENLSGNDEDAKIYRSFTGWRCGKRGAATSGAFVVELIKEPDNADDARRAMRTALAQVAPNSKPTDNELAGQPGISDTSKLNGKEFGIQVISFDKYLAVFIATPAKNLGAITDSVQVG
jgi:hypothetical protein